MSQRTPDQRPEQVLRADIRFWNDREASVDFAEPDTCLSEGDRLDALIRLVPHYYAKVMCDLGASDEAVELREHMGRVGKLALRGIDTLQTPSEVGDGIQRTRADVLPEGLALVSARNEAPRLVYHVALARFAGQLFPAGPDVFYSALAASSPDGDDSLKPRSALFLAHAVVSNLAPWWVCFGVGFALDRLSAIYAAGPHEWDTPQAMVLVPNLVVEQVMLLL